MKQYYITKPDGQNQGPLDEDFVREQYAAGAYEEGTTVWTDGMSDFTPISAAFADMKQALAVASPPPSSPKQYHVATPDGKQYGPADEAQIREWYAAGALSNEAMVWADSMPAWAPIASVFPELKPKAQPAMPPPVRFEAVAPVRVENTGHIPAPAENSSPEATQPSSIRRRKPRSRSSQSRGSKNFLHTYFAWSNVTRYQGRASRKEYWMTVLSCLIASIASYLLLIPMLAIDSEAISALLSLVLLALYVYICLLILAAGCRRLHDLDRSGWWLLLNLIPYVGSIILLVFMCMKGQNEANKYGTVPQD